MNQNSDAAGGKAFIRVSVPPKGHIRAMETVAEISVSEDASYITLETFNRETYTVNLDSDSDIARIFRIMIYEEPFGGQ